MHPVCVIDVELVIADSIIFADIKVVGVGICNDHLRVRVPDLVLINQLTAVFVSVITWNVGKGEGPVAPSQHVTLPEGTGIFWLIEVDVGCKVGAVCIISPDLDSSLGIGYRPFVFQTKHCTNLSPEVDAIILAEILPAATKIFLSISHPLEVDTLE